MRSFIKIILFLAVALLLGSCNKLQFEDSAIVEEGNIQSILHNFNWMASIGNNGIAFPDKPFLNTNAVGAIGMAGVCDINRDGEMEFLMSVNHVPRGIPSVEVFAIRENRLQSIGGFFEARDMPPTISYYTDEQGQLLFLQETQAYYGGIMNTVVATYLSDFRNVPIAGVRSYYGQEGTEIYYVFSSGETVECTNSFLSGNFDEQYTVTEEGYRLHLSQYMDSLTWIEDVSYDYCVQYHLYNYYELPSEIRYDEISQSDKTGGMEKFQTNEEYKKTGDMVADALYKAYIS